MGAIWDAWKRGECRIETAIYFPDDTFIEIVLDDCNEQYHLKGNRKSIEELVLRNGVDWFSEIDIFAEAMSGEYTVRVGDTPWEGSGHITLLKNISNGNDVLEELIWIISFEERGPFSSVRIEGKKIVANVKGEYGGGARCYIDIDKPQEIRFAYE